MNARDNTIRAVRFECPDHIPASFHISAACWSHYPQDALQDLMASHPLLFPNFQKSEPGIKPSLPPWQRAGKPYTDSWGCVWNTSDDGITGTVTRHALADWADFDSFTPPDPAANDGWAPINWSAIEAQIRDDRQHGRLVRGSLRHGHTFLTLSYIRGYENLIFDMCDGHPKLESLIRLVEEFNAEMVQRHIKAGVEWVGYPEDLGMQRGPILSPAMFRQYLKPTYQRLVQPARDAGCIVHMHSDGDIRVLVQDLLDVGMEVLNLQDLVNGIDWIAENLKGRVCIDLDIDRQSITRFGTPEQIDAHIHDAVTTLGSREGGLMLTHGLYPGVPLVNIEALMDAMERYVLHFTG